MTAYRHRPTVIEAEPYAPGMEDGFTADGKPYIATLEGVMMIAKNAMIVTGVKGERYPVALEVFEAVYEPADSLPWPPTISDELADRLLDEQNDLVERRAAAVQAMKEQDNPSEQTRREVKRLTALTYASFAKTKAAGLMRRALVEMEDARSCEQEALRWAEKMQDEEA